MQVLQGTRILSLALNLPGPAALMRLRQMGATCMKIEPPGGDPMVHYNQPAYVQLHEGITIQKADLKTQAGQDVLHHELSRTDVLLTSFRPSALKKLGITWDALHLRHPGLSQVAIVGGPGDRAEEPGHDLTYLAENGLVPGMELPATLYADMGGSLMTTEAVLQLCLMRRSTGRADDSAPGAFIEVALSSAASFLALPRQWGLTQPDGWIGGAHAGYRIYACKDGRVALAALEPHFAAALCKAAGIADSGINSLLTPATRERVAKFMLGKTCDEIDALAIEHGIPLCTLTR